jgi:predicted Zn-dependent protease
MSIQQTLAKAQHHVQSGQYDAAIKLYRGVLRLMPKQPQINSLLGAMLIQTGQAEAAADVLELAFAAEPAKPEHWVRLIVAHHRAGHVQRARELLPHGVALGIAPEHMDRFRQDLSEPPERSVQALNKMVASGKRLNAEIAARLLVSDYPESPAAQACLERVLAMEAAE